MYRLLAILILFAGCASAPEASTDDAAPAPDGQVEPANTSVAIADCVGMEFFVSVPEAAATPHFPEGLAPNAVAGQVLTAVGVMDCETGIRGFAALGAVATDDRFGVPMGTNLFWDPEHVVSNGTIRSAFDAAGVHMDNGTSEITIGPTVTATIELPSGTHTISGTTTAAVPSAVAANLLPAFREYFPAKGGLGYLDAGFEGDLLATTFIQVATLTTAPDTVLRDLVGESVQGPAIAFGVFGYPGAEIGHIAYG